MSGPIPLNDPNIAKALALWQQGHSIRGAAAQCGVHHVTLFRRVRDLKQREPQNERQEIALAALREARAIQLEAGRQTLELLQAGEIKPSQVPIVWGIASDKISRLIERGTETDKTPGAAKLFDLLAQGGKLTLEGPGSAAESASKSSQVIEITAEVEDPT